MRAFNLEAITDTIEHDILRHSMKHFKAREEAKIRQKLSNIDCEKAVDIVRAVNVASKEI